MVDLEGPEVLADQVVAAVAAEDTEQAAVAGHFATVAVQEAATVATEITTAAVMVLALAEIAAQAEQVRLLRVQAEAMAAV